MNQIDPLEEEQKDQRSLIAAIHYGVQKGDTAGGLSDGEAWNIARAIALELTNGKRRTTTSIPTGFVIRVKIERE